MVQAVLMLVDYLQLIVNILQVLKQHVKHLLLNAHKMIM